MSYSCNILHKKTLSVIIFNSKACCEYESFTHPNIQTYGPSLKITESPLSPVNPKKTQSVTRVVFNICSFTPKTQHNIISSDKVTWHDCELVVLRRVISASCDRIRNSRSWEVCLIYTMEPQISAHTKSNRQESEIRYLSWKRKEERMF